ncbi:MAG: BadF/BadG/BcrA/BcrD ATPase family protein [Melioribacteraceae bacterium]
MNYFIGIDGGGTKTKCVLTDENLNIKFQIQSGPSHFLTIGVDVVSETIVGLIQACLTNGNISSNELSAIVLGTTGAGRVADAEKLELAVNKLAKTNNLDLPVFKVVSDARIALEGAFSGKPGSILIAGTGSIMFGKDRAGEIHRVGGFGRLIGDEGSGLTLGRRGLSIVAKYFDGRIKETLLAKKVINKFGIANQSELITKVYSDEIKTQHVAPLVIEAASEGDEFCNKILNEETDELILHIATMNKKLNEEKMKLVFIGGTITNENFYSQMLKDKIKLYLPNVVLQQADYPPEVGAVIMAKQM